MRKESKEEMDHHTIKQLTKPPKQHRVEASRSRAKAKQSMLFAMINEMFKVGMLEKHGICYDL